MKFNLAMKLGQVAGALFLSYGFALMVMGQKSDAPFWFLSGAVFYGVCRLSSWLGTK